MSTATKNNIFLLTFLSVLFLSPILVSSAVIPTGSSCNPDILPPYIYPTQINAATCPQVKTAGGNILHLKWDIKGTFQHPECSVGCLVYGPQGLIDNCYSFGRFWPVTEGVPSIASRDDKNFLNVDGAKKNLKPKDDVYIRNTLPGDIYSVRCREKCDVGDTSCKPNPKQSVSAEVTSVAPCELPFSSISQAFEEGILPVNYSVPGKDLITITEDNLTDWVNDTEAEDAASIGGSGNFADIEKFVIFNQPASPGAGASCPPRVVYFNSKITYGGNMGADFSVQKLNDIVNVNGYPLGVTIRQLDWPMSYIPSTDNFSVISHQVMILAMRSRATSTGVDVDLDILDPNYPDRVTSLKECSNAMFNLKYPGKDWMDFDGLGCQSKYGEVFVFLSGDTAFEPSLSSLDAYHKWRTTLCAGSYKDKENCQRGRLTSWIKSNLTNFVNPSVGGGNCLSWTRFMLTAAYRGDFVGEDYHPGDKKYVGKGCRNDHYPIATQAAATQNQNWLASVVSFFPKLSF